MGVTFALGGFFAEAFFAEAFFAEAFFAEAFFAEAFFAEAFFAEAFFAPVVVFAVIPQPASVQRRALHAANDRINRPADVAGHMPPARFATLPEGAKQTLLDFLAQ